MQHNCVIFLKPLKHLSSSSMYNNFWINLILLDILLKQTIKSLHAIVKKQLRKITTRDTKTKKVIITLELEA